MFGLGFRLPELIIVLVVALLIFGPGKLPQLGKGVGEMIRGFKRETATDREEEPSRTPEVAGKA